MGNLDQRPLLLEREAGMRLRGVTPDEEERLFRWSSPWSLINAENNESAGFMLEKLPPRGTRPPFNGSLGPILQLVKDRNGMISSHLHFWQWTERRMSVRLEADFFSGPNRPKLPLTPAFTWRQSHCRSGNVSVSGTPGWEDADLWSLLQEVQMRLAGGSLTDDCGR